MKENILGKEPYFVLLNVPITVNDKKEKILTTFNKEQAKVAQAILNQTHEDRVQWGTAALNGLDQLRAKKQLMPDTNISATLKTGLLVVRMPVNLHWRCIRMLALVCVSGQDVLIRYLSGVLQNIECGLYEAKTTINPFDFLGK